MNRDAGKEESCSFHHIICDLSTGNSSHLQNLIIAYLDCGYKNLLNLNIEKHIFPVFNLGKIS